MDKMKKLVTIVTLLLTPLLSGCSNKILVRKMIEKYSDDSNYVTLSGEIVEYNYITLAKGLVVYIENDIIIKCEELRTYISYQTEKCHYHIFSDQTFDLSIGDEITFTTVPFHFYNGHELPIVELSIHGTTLLDYSEGKENLIYWVYNDFK